MKVMQGNEGKGTATTFHAEMKIKYFHCVLKFIIII